MQVNTKTFEFFNFLKEGYICLITWFDLYGI